MVLKIFLVKCFDPQTEVYVPAVSAGNPDCLQADVLQQVADSRLASLEKRESGQTFAAANNSLTVLRIRQAQTAH